MLAGDLPVRMGDAGHQQVVVVAVAGDFTAGAGFFQQFAAFAITFFLHRAIWRDAARQAGSLFIVLPDFLRAVFIDDSHSTFSRIPLVAAVKVWQVAPVTHGTYLFAFAFPLPVKLSASGKGAFFKHVIRAVFVALGFPGGVGGGAELAPFIIRILHQQQGFVFLQLRRADFCRGVIRQIQFVQPRAVLRLLITQQQGNACRVFQPYGQSVAVVQQEMLFTLREAGYFTAISLALYVHYPAVKR